MRHLLRTALVTAATSLLLAGCSGGDEEPDAAAPTELPPVESTYEPVDLQGSWVLDTGTLDGRPLDVQAATVTFAIDGDALTGNFGCSDYTLTFSQDDFGLTFGGGSAVPAQCPTAQEQLEAQFLDALGEVESGTRTDDSLVLVGDDSELRFSPA